MKVEARMLPPSLTTAFARTEKEVVDLAAANAYMKDELAVFRRRARMSFYSQVSPVWLMEHAERAALSMLVQLIKPRVVIEIGTRFGGSAFLFSQHAERVICIDVDNAVMMRCAGVPNIEVVIGSSRQKVPEILAS
jgi:predicted O-methyltransferase YrrM